MSIPMQAVRITEETYPIAAATLPGGFVEYPIKRTLGCWLIINKPESQTFEETGIRPVVLLTNCWLTDEEFEKRYYFVNEETPGQFADIMKY